MCKELIKLIRKRLRENIVHLTTEQSYSQTIKVVFQAVGIKTGLNRGLTRACLKQCGTMPDDKDLFMILVTMGIISSKQS